MDQKHWHWGKNSREKTILETDKANLTSKENEEVQTLLADKEQLEKDLKKLNDKLDFTLSNYNAKDEHMKKQTKIVQEAVSGWEKAEVEMLSMKEHLEESIHQQLIYEERVFHLNCTLKECMQQLHFAREEQEQRIYDAVMKASKQFDQARTVLEEQLSETSKRLAKVVIENSYLNKSLAAKDNLTEDLKRQLAHAEAGHNALMIRLESIERDNNSLKYEARVVQKELDIRNEEREYNRRTADASYKQQSESVKTIVKLESECQRLRHLAWKRLPSPAASLMAEDSSETAMKRITYLTEQLCAVEEENKTLKESLSRKMNEIQFSRVMLSRTASKLLQLESEIASKSQVALEQPRINLALQELCSASMSEIGSYDNVSCAESSAIAELERFRSVGPSDINLRDDFIEIEKLALSDHHSVFSISNQETCSKDMLKGYIPGWFQDVVKVTLEQNCVTHKNPDDILEDINLAMKHLNNNSDQCTFDSGKDSSQFDASNPSHLSLHTSAEPLNYSVVDSSGEVNDAGTSSIKRTKHKSQRVLNKSIGKLIELIEGINMPSDDNNNSDLSCKRDQNIHSHNNQGVSIGYMVRVFQWKTSDLGDVLQKFLNVCYNLLNGVADHEKFATELTTALEWIINHCFSLQDVSSMEDAIKKQFDWDETLTYSGCHDYPTQKMQYDQKEESKNSKDKPNSSESEKKALERRLQTNANQHQELEETIACLRLELQTFKESNRILEDRIQNDASINKDLDTQLIETELKEAYHKILALEVELESKNHYCDELDIKCLELQLQLESMKRECSNGYINLKNEPVRTEWEITVASEKLAECQETIIHLEKQLKALAERKDVCLFDNIIAAHRPIITNTTSVSVPLKVDTKAKNRPSLLDQMLADDDAKAKVCKTSERSFIQQPLEKIVVLKGLKGREDGANVKSLAILPVKKSGGRSLWKRLLGKRRKPKRKHVYQFNK